MATKQDIIDYLIEVHGFKQEGVVYLSPPGSFTGLVGQRVFVTEYQGVVRMEVVDMDMGEALFKGRVSNPEQAELILRLTGVIQE